MLKTNKAYKNARMNLKLLSEKKQPHMLNRKAEMKAAFVISNELKPQSRG